jgi:hypothetical protein
VFFTTVSNWPRLLTNQFDAGGNFSFTIAIHSNSACGFYSLQMP